MYAYMEIKKMKNNVYLKINRRAVMNFYQYQ